MLIIECEWLAVPSGELEEGPFFVTVEEGSITGVQREKPAQREGEGEDSSGQQWLHTYLLTPGFIDLHTHGIG